LITVPDLTAIKDEAVKRAFEALMAQLGVLQTLVITDGVKIPTAHSKQATIYIDVADGDLKIIFGDGKIATIVVDT